MLDHTPANPSFPPFTRPSSFGAKQKMAYTYCETPESVDAAVAVLRTSPYIVVDCEGESMGELNSHLSLICVGTSDARDVYLFDVVALSKNDIKPLLYLLTNPKQCKIVWDGRHDFYEILIMYGIRMQYVLDLQIAELTSRWRVRGEGPWEQKKRLSLSHFGSRRVKQNPEIFANLHLVMGMQRCVEDLWLDSGKDMQVKESFKDGGSKIWMARPLPENFLQYAAKDIKLIAALYHHFHNMGWVSNDSHLTLSMQTQRYLESTAEIPRLEGGDIFSNNALLPMDVLHAPRGPFKACAGCRRVMSVTCFQVLRDATSRYDPRYDTNAKHRAHCLRCFALAMKSNMDERIFKVWE